jgi:hypothetical protein
MASKERRGLIENLEALLVPELERRGFHRVPLTADEARSEIRTGLPFGRLRREGPAGFEIVEIQLDKRRAPVFRLNLGVAPPGGIQHPVTGHVAQEDIWAHYLDRSYGVYPAGWLPKWFPFPRWFSVPRRPGAEATRADYEKLASERSSSFRRSKRSSVKGSAGPTSAKCG